MQEFIQKSELRWSFSSLGWPTATFSEMVALARQFELETIELRSLNGRLDLPRVLGEAPGGFSKLRAELDDSGIQIACLGTSFKLSQTSDAERLGLLDFARCAEELNVPYLRVFGGGEWTGSVEPKMLKSVRSTVAWWRKLRLDRGWKTDLILETHDAFCDTRTVLELFDAAGAPMPLIWDSHHTWKLGKEPLMATWSALRDSVKHVHYKDSISQPSARHPYTYVLPGDGEFPSQELFSLLSREGFAGPISLEWEKQWHPELPDLSLALEKARQIAGW